MGAEDAIHVGRRFYRLFADLDIGPGEGSREGVCLAKTGNVNRFPDFFATGHAFPGNLHQMAGRPSELPGTGRPAKAAPAMGDTSRILCRRRSIPRFVRVAADLTGG